MISCVALIMGGALFAGCQDDDDAVTGYQEKRITFNLKVPHLQLVRSTPGVGDENGGADDRLAFYQFSKEGVYEQRYVLPYNGYVSEDTENHIRSYSLKISSTSSGEKKFVVLEAADYDNFPSFTEEQTMDDLLHTKTQVCDELLTAPFVMSSTGENEEGFVTIANVESPDNKVDLQLKRRVARFDLVNDPAVSGLVIDKVFVKNRRTCGFLGNVDGFAGDVTTDVLEIAAADLANGGKSFYLYPTLLSADVEQNEKTTIWATTRIVEGHHRAYASAGFGRRFEGGSQLPVSAGHEKHRRIKPV